MEEEIEKGSNVGYRGIEFGWPLPHDAFGGHGERIFASIPPQNRFHHLKVVGSNPAPHPKAAAYRRLYRGPVQWRSF